jgi:hypothetical protein
LKFYCNFQTKGGKHFGLAESPYIDFVKPAFTFLGRKKEPILPRDVLIVVWRSGGVAAAPSSSSSTPVATGLLFVPLKDEQPSGASTSLANEFDATDSGTNDGARYFEVNSLDLDMQNNVSGTTCESF